MSPTQRTPPEISPKVGGAPIRFLVVGSPIDCELLSIAMKHFRQPFDVVVGLALFPSCDLCQKEEM